MNSEEPFPVTGDLDRLLESLVREEQRLAADEMEEPPEWIGRYRVHRAVGRGGFGCVYLAMDDQLQRPVAIKTPHRTQFATAEQAEAYLNEARIVAGLDHRAIVPVYDVGRTDDGLCYVVSKWVEGGDLSVLLAKGRPAFAAAGKIVAVLAEALHYTHLQGLVHRDIKPANVLLDSDGEPLLADFGLALRDDDETGGGGAGTPLYMSPEQARREGHRIDGRSDIFSLGVVLFELLTGRRPFRGDDVAAVLQEIIHVEARPLRSIDDTIPRELERITLKALAKRVVDRYQTAGDLAEDLRAYLAACREDAPPIPPEGPPADPEKTQRIDTVVASHLRTTGVERAPAAVSPKGLRSFDREDAAFFLRLLPGPVDREGLPTSVRFWKGVLETRDEARAASVAVMYGPSGCGKSSLMRAGITPHLPPEVRVLHVEAAAGELETRLRKALGDGGEQERSLAEIVGRRRRSDTAEKTVLVIDQFEQWLHGWSGGSTDDLIAALRQCDGVRVQALLLVRDDFWLALSRFMQQLEIRLVEGVNSALVDLFDIPHAARVLTEFGRAYGTLPAAPKAPERNQLRFVMESAAALAEERRVVCVRLALFAEMMKDRPWEPATLRRLGGAEGVGFAFLEETFSETRAPPLHRLHAPAARKLLQALLPAAETDIKGASRSRGELLKQSGYEKRPDDFSALLELLDEELRLITPADASSIDAAGDSGVLEERRYQLTHDYLVPSLRTWLQAKRRETPGGRAALRLEEYADLARMGVARRVTPGLSDYVAMLLRTDRRRWTESQRDFMRGAGRTYLQRAALILAAVALLSPMLIVWRRGDLARVARSRAAGLLAAQPREVPRLALQLEDDDLGRWADQVYRDQLANVAADPEDALAAACALFPREPQIAGDVLLAALRQGPPSTRWLEVIQWSLGRRPAEARALLEAPFLQANDPAIRLHLAAGLVAVASVDDDLWTGAAAPLAGALVNVDVARAADWIDALQPVLPRLQARLDAELDDRGRDTADRRRVATMALLSIHRQRDDVLALANLARLAPAADFPAVVDALGDASEGSRRLLGDRFRQELPLLPPTKRDEYQAADDVAERGLARWAIASLLLGDDQPLLDCLAGRADLTLQTAALIEFSECGPADRLPELAAAVVARRDASLARAYLTLLGIQADSLPNATPSLNQVAAAFSDEPVQAAADWARSQSVGDETPLLGEAPTMIAVAAPGEIQLGDPPDTPVLDKDYESLRTATIDYDYQLAATETTIGRFAAFWEDDAWLATPHAGARPERRLWDAIAGRGLNEDFIRPPRDACPVVNVAWTEAAEYCNWLSWRAGLPEAAWCFRPGDDGALVAKENATQLAGFRLPTAAEWEHGSRAEAPALRFFGRGGPQAAALFAWFDDDSDQALHPVARLAPNPLGLFDVYGNAMEWSLDDLGAAAAPENRLLKGGSFANRFEYIRSGHSFRTQPKILSPQVGFRVARTTPAVDASAE